MTESDVVTMLRARELTAWKQWRATLAVFSQNDAMTQWQKAHRALVEELAARSGLRR